MISQKDRDSMQKFVEGTRQDKTRDKKMGAKEGSSADSSADRTQAKSMLARGNKNQMPAKGWSK